MWLDAGQRMGFRSQLHLLDAALTHCVNRDVSLKTKKRKLCIE